MIRNTLLGCEVRIGLLEKGFRQEIAAMRPASVFVLADENTAHACLPLLHKKCPGLEFRLMTIPAGESSKQLSTCEQIWDTLADAGAGRDSLFISLGGGVVTDIGGFCAATFLRGMRFVHVPTSLMGMVDAAIGGKTGVDFRQFKNYLGVIRQPDLLWIDPEFLKTLPSREVKNGMAEIIKHAIIADTDLFQLLEYTSIEELDVAALIPRSAEIKMEIVRRDEFEADERKKLNFGHTIGHALESYYLSKQNRLLHGEAIAIGMEVETILSAQTVGLPSQDQNRIIRVLHHYFGHHDLTDLDLNETMKLLAGDKKKVRGNVGFSLIKGLGLAETNIPVDEALILKALQQYMSSIDHVTDTP